MGVQKYTADATIRNISYQPHPVNPYGVPSKAVLSIESRYCTARAWLQAVYEAKQSCHFAFLDGYEFATAQSFDDGKGLFLTGAAPSTGPRPIPTTKPDSAGEKEGHRVGLLHLRSNIWLAVGESERAPGGFVGLGMLNLHDWHDGAADIVWENDEWCEAYPWQNAERISHLSSKREVEIV